VHLGAKRRTSRVDWEIATQRRPNRLAASLIARRFELQFAGQYNDDQGYGG
jgi:hypothetical protein